MIMRLLQLTGLGLMLPACFSTADFSLCKDKAEGDPCGTTYQCIAGECVLPDAGTDPDAGLVDAQVITSERLPELQRGTGGTLRIESTTVESLNSGIYGFDVVELMNPLDGSGVNLPPLTGLGGKGGDGGDTMTDGEVGRATTSLAGGGPGGTELMPEGQKGADGISTISCDRQPRAGEGGVSGSGGGGGRGGLCSGGGAGGGGGRAGGSLTIIAHEKIIIHGSILMKGELGLILPGEAGAECTDDTPGAGGSGTTDAGPGESGDGGDGGQGGAGSGGFIYLKAPIIIIDPGVELNVSGPAGNGGVIYISSTSEIPATVRVGLRDDCGP